jgi:hypothetical protein
VVDWPSGQQGFDLPSEAIGASTGTGVLVAGVSPADAR